MPQVGLSMTAYMRLPILLCRGIGGLNGGVFIAEVTVFPGQTFGLFFQNLEILLFLGKLLLQVSNLIGTASRFDFNA